MFSLSSQLFSSRLLNCRAMLILRSRGLKDNNGAIANYEESVEFLTKLPEKDLEVRQKCAHINFCSLC